MRGCDERIGVHCCVWALAKAPSSARRVLYPGSKGLLRPPIVVNGSIVMSPQDIYNYLEALLFRGKITGYRKLGQLQGNSGFVVNEVADVDATIEVIKKSSR